jgi:hypothetical protein
MVRTRRAASAGAVETHERDVKARTRKLACEVVRVSWPLSAERSGARTDVPSSGASQNCLLGVEVQLGLVLVAPGVLLSALAALGVAPRRRDGRRNG